MHRLLRSSGLAMKPMLLGLISLLGRVKRKLVRCAGSMLLHCDCAECWPTSDASRQGVSPWWQRLVGSWDAALAVVVADG